MLPQQEISIERSDGVVTVSTAGSDILLDLPEDVARHIFVGVALTRIRRRERGPVVPLGDAFVR